MAIYDTIPTEGEALVEKPTKSSTRLKGIVAAAAVASFVLGAVAMTSVNASVAQPAAAFTSSKKASITNVHISLDSTNGDKCLTLNGDGDLILNKCGNGDGSGSHSKQRFTYTHKGNSGRIVALHPEDQSVNTVQPAVSCSEYSLPCDMYLWFATSDSEEPGQNLFWDPSTKQIKTGSGFCMTAEGSKNGKKILAEKCNGKAKLQQWQIGDAPAPPPHDGPSCPTGMYDTGGWKQAGEGTPWKCGAGCAGGAGSSSQGGFRDRDCNCACQCSSGNPAVLRNSAGPCKSAPVKLNCALAPQNKNGPTCFNDSDCNIFGLKYSKCSKCVDYGDGVRKWCQAK